MAIKDDTGSTIITMVKLKQNKQMKDMRNYIDKTIMRGLPKREKGHSSSKNIPAPNSKEILAGEPIEEVKTVGEITYNILTYPVLRERERFLDQKTGPSKTRKGRRKREPGPDQPLIENYFKKIKTENHDCGTIFIFVLEHDSNMFCLLLK